MKGVIIFKRTNSDSIALTEESVIALMKLGKKLDGDEGDKVEVFLAKEGQIVIMDGAFRVLGAERLEKVKELTINEYRRGLVKLIKSEEKESPKDMNKTLKNFFETPTVLVTKNGYFVIDKVFAEELSARVKNKQGTDKFSVGVVTGDDWTLTPEGGVIIQGDAVVTDVGTFQQDKFDEWLKDIREFKSMSVNSEYELVKNDWR